MKLPGFLTFSRLFSIFRGASEKPQHFVVPFESLREITAHVPIENDLLENNEKERAQAQWQKMSYTIGATPCVSDDDRRGFASIARDLSSIGGLIAESAGDRVRIDLELASRLKNSFGWFLEASEFYRKNASLGPNVVRLRPETKAKDDFVFSTPEENTEKWEAIEPFRHKLAALLADAPSPPRPSETFRGEPPLPPQLDF